MDGVAQNPMVCQVCGAQGYLTTHVHVVDRVLTKRTREVRQKTLNACGACAAQLDTRNYPPTKIRKRVLKRDRSVAENFKDKMKKERRDV